MVDDIVKIPNRLKVKVKGKDFVIQIGVSFAGMEEVEAALAGDGTGYEGGAESVGDDNLALELRRSINEIAGTEVVEGSASVGGTQEAEVPEVEIGPKQDGGPGENGCRLVMRKDEGNEVGQMEVRNEELGREEDSWASDLMRMDSSMGRTNSGELEKFTLDPIELEIKNNIEELNLLNIPILPDQGYWGPAYTNETEMGNIDVEPIRIIKPRICGGGISTRGRGKKAGSRIIRASDFLVKPVQRIVKQQKRMRSWQFVGARRKSGVVLEEMEDERAVSVSGGLRR